MGSKNIALPDQKSCLVHPSQNQLQQVAINNNIYNPHQTQTEQYIHKPNFNPSLNKYSIKTNIQMFIITR